MRKFGLAHLATLLMAVSMINASSLHADDGDQALYLKRISDVGANSNTRDLYDTMEAVPGAATVPPLPTAAHPALSPQALKAAVEYGLANKSKTLMVWHDGALVAEAYGQGADASTLINAKSMGKPVGAIAVGRAIALGKIKSLDQSAADFITEWKGTPKAAITLRMLMTMTAGLAQQGAVGDPANIMTLAYLSPHHGQVMINDYPLTAAPGTSYQYSNASADLIAVVIERATGRRYAEFVSTEIIKPLGAAGGEVWVDRPGGLAHAGCCILFPAQTWMRIGLLLMDDGVWRGQRLLPVGYVQEMKTPTAQNPRYGSGVWLPGEYIQRRGFGRPDQMLGAVLHSAPYLAKDLFLFDGNANQVLYMIPSKKLAILRMGDAPPKSPEWDNSYLPNLLVGDLARP